MANNAGIYGTNAAIAKSSTINVTGGTYTTSTAVWNIGDGTAGTGGIVFSGASTIANVAGLNIGSSGDVNVELTGGAQMNATFQVQVGRGASTNVGRFTVDGGTFKANGTNTSDAVALIGRDKGKGILDQTSGRTEIIGNGFTNTGGGVLVLNAANRGDAAGSGTLNVSGGTMVVKDIRFNGTNQHQQDLSNIGSSTLNLSGGSLYVGGTVIDNTSQNASGTGGVSGSNFTTQGGISNRGVGAATYAVNLSGGTLGANANFVASVNMSLTNTTTIKAASEADVARNITFSGNLTGTGGINKTGGGLLTISGATTTYEGGTTLAAGSLATGSTGSFGSGDVTITGPATLILGNTQSISDLAALMFTSDSSVQLGASGGDIETIGSLWNSTSSETIAAGTYTATELNSEFGVSVFSGNGSLTILTGIPEPSTAALMALGMVAMFRRRR